MSGGASGAAAPAAPAVIGHFRCYKCETLLAADATACACGGGPGPTFGLLFDTPSGGGAAPVAGDADVAEASEPGVPTAIAPPAAARRVAAGGRLSGSLLLRAPSWEREGVVTLRLVCVARGPQKASNLTRHDQSVTLASGRLDEHGRWPFTFEVPAFPPSHQGLVEIDWYLRATLAPPKGPDTTWTWQLYVQPGAGTPAAERRKNAAANLAAAFRAVRFVSFPLTVLGAMVAVPALALARGLRGDPDAVGLAFGAALVSAFLAWYAGSWLGAGLRRALRYARGWLHPRPAVSRVLRLGEAAPIGLRPGYAWALVRVDEASAREERSGTSGLYRTTVWSYATTTVATGTGSGTLLVPADATPSFATGTRRVRWELRVWPRQRPDLWHAHGLEILAAYAPGAEPPGGLGAQAPGPAAAGRAAE